MKKILSWILALALCVSLAPTVLAISGDEWDEDDVPYPVEGGNIYFDLETGTVTGSDEAVTSANIPEEINGVKVKRIGANAFDLRLELTHVTVPSGVTEIADYAFEYCEELTSISLPSGLTRVGQNAFRDCESLETLVLPDSVTYIGSNFLKGAGVKSFTIPRGVTAIENSTFAYSEVTNVTIPDTVKTIKGSAFMHCNGLTSISIPGSVTSLEDNIFFRCASLRDIYFDGTEGEWTALAGDGQRLFDAYQGDVDLSKVTVHFSGKGNVPSDPSDPADTPEPSNPSGPSSPSDVQPGGSSPAAVSFTDVSAKAYYADAVKWAVEKEVTNGTSKTTFSPGKDCTRAEIVTFLWRAKGQPEPTTTVNPFTDVKASSFAYKAILWAVEEGITTGTGKNTFNPNGVCTRGEAVTFLWRAAKKPAASGSVAFTDVSTGAFYSNAVKWAVEEKITTGVTSTTFAPKKNCTRGDIVTFLWRNLGK